MSSTSGPALTHVHYWVGKKWVPITAEEARKLFPYGACAGSKLFMCGACQSFVLLTREGANHAHFRHKRSGANDLCPDYRGGGPFAQDRDSFFKTRGLPIHIKAETNGEALFELGFTPLPDEVLRNAPPSMIRITCQPSGERLSFSTARRLVPGAMTYVTVSSNLPERIEIQVTPAEKNPFSEWWPKEVTGVASGAEGALFDGKTHKLLPPDADVLTEHPYWLLTQNFEQSCDGITVRRLMSPEVRGWRLYEATATDYCEKSAKFFLRYRARLTETPAKLLPVWPPTVQAPRFIYHNAERLYLCKVGNARVQIFPRDTISQSKKIQDFALFSFRTAERCRQAVSAGRSSVLRFYYVWKKSDYPQSPAPEVRVTDRKGNAFDPGPQQVLPPEGELRITSPWGGRVILKEAGTIANEIELRPEETVRLRKLTRKSSVEIFVGCDLVQSFDFSPPPSPASPQNQTPEDDARLAAILAPSRNDTLVPVSHAFAAVLARREFPPRVKTEIYRAVRRGTMPGRLYAYIKNTIVGK